MRAVPGDAGWRMRIRSAATLFAPTVDREGKSAVPATRSVSARASTTTVFPTIAAGLYEAGTGSRVFASRASTLEGSSSRSRSGPIGLVPETSPPTAMSTGVFAATLSGRLRVKTSAGPRPATPPA